MNDFNPNDLDAIYERITYEARVVFTWDHATDADIEYMGFRLRKCVDETEKLGAVASAYFVDIRPAVISKDGRYQGNAEGRFQWAQGKEEDE